jgi:hypothetical protein
MKISNQLLLLMEDESGNKEDEYEERYICRRCKNKQLLAKQYLIIEPK